MQEYIISVGKDAWRVNSWWLASPFHGYGQGMIMVVDNDGTFMQFRLEESSGTRPIVSIPVTEFQSFTLSD